MMPSPAGFSASGPDELCAFIQKQVEYGENLSRAIADVAYVLMSNGGSPNVDVAERLRDALTDWFCAGPLEQIQKIKTAPPPVNGFVYPPPSVERLSQLVRQRDTVQQTLVRYQEVADNSNELPGGQVMAEYIKVLCLPAEQELERIEREISEMQADLERATPPEA